MTRYDRRVWLLAAGLSALAGYVDAVGFLSLGGYFVSFMSGNSTRLAADLASGTHAAVLAGGLIAAFVIGVMSGTLVGRFARRRRPVVIGLVTLLLALAATCGTAGWTVAAGLLMALAMGAENATFERDGEVSIGLTYMTGALVKFGQRLTGALLGGDRRGWQPYLLLWLGLVGGAVTGALAFGRLGLPALWPAAGAALLLTLAAARLPEH